MIRSLAVLLVLALAPLRASAQDAPPADPSVELFDRGVELLRDGDHREAAAAFRESYRLAPRVTTMCNLALTYDRWGPEHRAQAVRAYRTCARDDDTGRFRAFAERRVGEIERELVLLEVDGDAQRDEVDEAQVEADVEAEVEETEVVDEPDEAPAEPSPPPRAEPDHMLLYAGLGTGALALGSTIAGIVLALDAQSTVDALRDELGPSPVIVRGSPQHERLESAHDAANAATGLYVAAGVLGAAAATLVVIDLVTTSAEREGTVTLSPTPGGIAIAGRF